MLYSAHNTPCMARPPQRASNRAMHGPEDYERCLYICSALYRRLGAANLTPIHHYLMITARLPNDYVPRNRSYRPRFLACRPKTVDFRYESGRLPKENPPFVHPRSPGTWPKPLGFSCNGDNRAHVVGAILPEKYPKMRSLRRDPVPAHTLSQARKHAFLGPILGYHRPHFASRKARHK